MKKTKPYQFRSYTIHVPEELCVYIGNDETEFLVYKDNPTHILISRICWLEHRQSLKFVDGWRTSFEHEIGDCKTFYIDYDPNFNY